MLFKEEKENKHPQLLKITAEELKSILTKEKVSVYLSLENNKAFTVNRLIEGRCSIEKIQMEENLILDFDIHESISFEECHLKEVIIEKYVKSIHFSHRCILKDVKVRKNAKVPNLASYNAYLDNLSIVADAQVNQLSLSFDSKIKRSLDIREEAQIHYLKIQGTTQIGELWIEDNAQIKDIAIRHNSHIKKFHLNHNAQIDEITVTDNAKVEEFELIRGEIIRKFEFRNLTTDLGIKFTGIGTKLPRKLIFSHVKAKSIHFYETHINAILQLTDVGPSIEQQGVLEFTRSSFDKLELIGNSFEDFNALIFQNSDITSAFIVETEFPETIEYSQEFSTNNPIQSLSQAKSFYEQIKMSHQKQGNNTAALSFQAKELNAHFNLLDWKTNFWDKSTLFFNKYTTEFGTNWSRGFSVLILFSVLLYFLLIVNTSNVRLTWPWKMEWSEFRTYFSEYFEFINPTSNIWKRWDYIFELENVDPKTGKLPGGIKGMLLFSKIIIITLIYQIVQAFRKFGKK